jgi:hypothetical protein
MHEGQIPAHRGHFGGAARAARVEIKSGSLKTAASENNLILLQNLDVHGLGPFASFGHLEFNALVFENFAPVAHIGQVAAVYENIAAAVLSDKSIPLCGIKPLDDALRHAVPPIDPSARSAPACSQGFIKWITPLMLGRHSATALLNLRRFLQG